MATLVLLLAVVSPARGQEDATPVPGDTPPETEAIQPESPPLSTRDEPSWLRAVESITGPVGRDARFFPGSRVLERAGSGRRIGNLLLNGAVSGSLGYDSNVDDEAKSDPGALAAANLTVRAEPILTRHAAVFTGSVSATGILPQVDEADLSLALGAAGTLDLSRRDQLDGSMFYVRSIENPTSTGVNDMASAGNVADTGRRTYDQLIASSIYRRLYPRAAIAVGPSVTAAFYEDDSSSNYVQPQFSAGYKRTINPTLSGTLESRITRTIYPDQDAEGEGDSTLVGLSVGAGWLPRERTAADLAIGVERIEFDDSRSQGRTGLIFSGGVGAPLGERTRASLRASRQFDATSDVQDTDVATVTQIDAAMDRQLGPDLTLSVRLGGALVDYQGSGRRDQVVDTGVSLARVVRDNLILTAGMTYARRMSNEEEDIDDFVITVGFTVGF